jgi:hypothetical protein
LDKYLTEILNKWYTASILKNQYVNSTEIKLNENAHFG